MMKKVKIALLLAAVCISVFGFASCKVTGDDIIPDNNPVTVDDNVIYSPDVTATLVLGEGVEQSDVRGIITAYYKQTGKEIVIGSPKDSPADHEIIIGKTDREISNRAYRTLIIIDNEENVGYSIYSNGKSVAIAFDEPVFGEPVAFNEAIDCFIEIYMQAGSLKLKEGNVFYESFDALQRQEKREEKSIENHWELKLSQIIAKLDGNEELANAIVKELKGLYSTYNKDYSIVNWVANLYDPMTGGFYYSPSARDNQGYLPDLESTSEALGIVEAILTGYLGTMNDYFGEEVGAKFISFAKDMQDENGYFYHPQWSRSDIDKNIDKRTRDVLNALNVLELFGATPTYSIPGGANNESTVTPVSSLTAPLSLSRTTAVISLAAAVSEEVYIPPHMKSEATFKSYLAGLDIQNDTVDVCEELYGDIELIKIVDEIYEEKGVDCHLTKTLSNYLSQYQNRVSGLWSNKSAVTYAEAGEISSVIRLYDAMGIAVPRNGDIITTMIRILESDDVPANISEIASVWTSLCAVVNNILSCSDKEEMEDVKYRLSSLYSDFDGVLKMTKAKLSYFQRDDGSFSTTPEGSAAESGGMPVAIPGMQEGDMNATLLAVKNIWLSVFGSLDIGSVPIFWASDRMMFQKTRLDMGIIIKNEIKKPEPIDFEDAAIGSTADLKLAMTTELSKVEVKFNEERQSKVLEVYSSQSGTWDQYFFDVTSSVKNPSCLSYELDLCVLPETSEGAFAHLYIYADTYAISLYREGDSINFYEVSSRSSADSYTHDLGVIAKVGEWVKIGVEYYPGTHDTVRAKVFFNGVCIAVTDNYFETPPVKYNGYGVPNAKYSNFTIYGCPSKEMTMLVDNIVTESTYKSYTVETGTTLNRNIDTPDKAQTVHTFEDTLIGNVPDGFIKGASASGVGVNTDLDGNKVLSFSESGGKLVVPLDQRGLGINSAVVEFDLTVDSSSAVGAKYQISFNEYMYAYKNFGSVHLVVMEENGTKYAALADAAAGKTSTVYSAIKIALEVKHHVKFQIFFNEEAIVVWIDGEMVGVNTNVLKGCRKYYMGETTIEAITPSVKSTISIDNLVSERVKSNFEEMTAPSIDREIYTFDTADKITLSGISPTKGELAFEGIAAKDVYAQFPVNSRVSVPTIGIVGFDVKTSTSNYGTLLVSFTDKAGNIISTFALTSDGTNVDIYEYTENGKYKTPIHTVKKQSFNLSIEYGDKMQSFNILVDGEYVAASSFTYTKDSGSCKFEALRLSSFGSVGFTVDNLYSEKTSGVFKAQTVSMANTDNTDEVMTYETSSYASMSTRLELHPSAPTSYFRIKEASVYDEITKVLVFNSGKGTSNDHLIFGRTQTAQEANAAFFETDVMIETTDGLFSVLIEPRSRTMLAYAFSMETDGTGQNITVLGDLGGDFSKTLDVKEGEWFKLRLEYANIGDERLIYRAYINGTMVGEGYTPRYMGEIPNYADINQVRLTVSPGIAGRMYFDNTSLGQFDMEFDESTVPNTQITGPQTMDELLPGGTLPEYLAIFNKNAIGELLSEEGHGTYAKFTLTTRGDYIQFSPMNTGLSATDATAFEWSFDIKLKTPGKERYEKLEFFFIDSKTNTIMHDNLIYGRDNYTTDHLLIEDDTFDPTKTFAGVETTEWFNIKVVIYKGDPNCYVYVNGDTENPFINTKLYGNSKDFNGDLSRIARARILLYDTRSLGSEVCIDNVFCGYTKNTNPAAN